MKQFDVILVLSCGIDKHGQLTNGARNSTEIAVKLFEQSLAPLLIFSGNYSYKAGFIPPVSESQAMKDYAISLGVPSDKVLIEAESKDTLGNAYFSKMNLLRPLGLTNVSVLRGPNQSEERLRYIFDKVFGDEIVYEFTQDYDDRPEEYERERKSLAVLKNWFDATADGDSDAVYRIMREKHPAYSSNKGSFEALQSQLEKA